MDVYSLFPVPVASFSIGRKLTAPEFSFIDGLPRTVNPGNAQSDNRNVLDNKKLAKIKAFIQESLDKYIEVIHAPKNKIKLRITQSWCNYAEAEQYHPKHTHINSFVSGTFYVQTTEEDKIEFCREPVPSLKFETEKWNVWNADTWWLKTTQGELLLFPSALQHFVRPVTSKTTRISLSFNTFPVGNFGMDDALAGLCLSE